MRKFAFLPLLAIVLGSPIVSNASTSNDVKWRNNVHGARYGEIVVVHGGPFQFIAGVYNTLGLNTCPEAQWKALDVAAIKKQFKARTVLLNGPRYFLMDRISLANPGPVATFTGGFQARRDAQLKISLWNVLKGQSTPYAENVVKRTTQYVFNKGRMVYELHAPDGSIYTMQSYAQIVDPKLTEADLANLGSRLKLPSGWKYNVRKLDKDYVAKVNGTAYVIQDDFKNSYQLNPGTGPHR